MFKIIYALLFQLVNISISALKWPIAALMVFLLLPMFEALKYFNLMNEKFMAFAVGFAAYIVIKFMSSAQVNNSLLTLAHEMTHIVFAWLTLHKVTHIHLNMDDTGGAMAFKGRGNWLIAIAPYFFPLVVFVIMLGMTFFSKKIPDSLAVNGMLGYFFAYHVEGIKVQVHPEQTDFKVVGFPFCFLFLPGANLFMFSAIMAFNNGGWLGIQKYVYVVSKLTERLYAGYWEQITNL